jgi:SulP family sulfate permease
MGGCAMIGQTMINVKNGARTRLSTFLAGVFLVILCIVFGPVVSDIPMAVLVAVMVLVSFGTFDWHSVAPATLKRMPIGEITVMIVTVAVVVATVTALVDPDGSQVVYTVNGELFFASSNDLVYQFDYANDPDKVIIDVASAHVWDASSVAALDAITTKYAARGKTVEIIGLNEHSAKMHGALSGELTGSH